MMSRGLAGALAGAIVGIGTSFGGGFYAFVGGSTPFPRPGPPGLVALLPDPLVGLLGGILGLIGATILWLARRGLARVR